jgi:Tol biopolymer transport system component
MAIWVADVSGATAARRLTFEGLNRFPVWSPDGTRITFQSQRGDDRSLYWQRADGAGAAERLTQAEPGAAHAPQSWSPDGSHLLFDETKDGLVSIWLYASRDRTSRRLVSEGSRVPSGAVFSPDGRWFAYTTKERNQVKAARVYVQPFPPTGSKYLVAGPDEDGHHPAWSRDGRELFYTPGPGTRLQKVAITTTPSFQFSQAVTLSRRFTNAPAALPRTYDVTNDGRFLGLIESDAVKDSGVPLSQIYVVLNWFEELKAKVPVR